MKTQHSLAPRGGILDLDDARREGRATTRRTGFAAAAGVIFAIVLAACSPSASTVPASSLALPSVNPSALASAATGAALTALDQVDVAIAANQSSNALTADEAASLTQLSSGLRTALTSGDMTAARNAVQSLASKVDSVAAKLTGPAGTQLTAAITALKAAIPAS